MKVVFVETEFCDRAYFEKALDGCEVRFADSLSDVDADVDILSIFIGSQITGEFLDCHPCLRMISTRSTTHDHIDLESCARHGVLVCEVGSYGDHVVAEHTFALLLALTRRLREAMHLNGGKHFCYESLRGVELHGKTFGIFGAGRIGRRAAPIAKALGMRVIANDIVKHPEGLALGIHYVTFRELLRRSDVISLHAGLTPETWHIFGAEAFAQCRRGVLILNTARGRLIDTVALDRALDSGMIGGAGLDVLGEEGPLRRAPAKLIADQIMEHLRGKDFGHHRERSKEIGKLMLIGRLLERPNVVFTPHTAFNCIESIQRINEVTVRNIRRFLEGKPSNTVTPGSDPQPDILPADELCLSADI